MCLLTATLEAYLAGHTEPILPAAIISGSLCGLRQPVPLHPQYRCFRQAGAKKTNSFRFPRLASGSEFGKNGGLFFERQPGADSGKHNLLLLLQVGAHGFLKH